MSTQVRPGRPRQSGPAGDVPTSGAAKSGETEKAPAQDVVVELSQTAQLEAAVLRLGGDIPVDSARVAQLREQLGNGDYQLNPERIAQRLVAQDSDF